MYYLLRLFKHVVTSRSAIEICSFASLSLNWKCYTIGAYLMVLWIALKNVSQHPQGMTRKMIENLV